MPRSRPTPIRTDGSNAFAHRSMKERVPGIIEDVAERNPDYPSSVQEALRQLAEDIRTDRPLRLFARPAPDHRAWAADFEAHRGDTWLGAEWLFSEVLAYRLVLEACRYWTTRRDPFRPLKQEELASDGLWEALGTALAAEGDAEERLHLHLAASLWGNRLDYSITQSAAQGTAAEDEHLLADDRPAVARHLRAEAPGPVHLIMDNAGTEQALDFALADFLLEAELAETVTLHIKMQPTLVSDATGEDVALMLDAFEQRGGPAEALGTRLRDHVRAGRLTIVPDFFWTTAGELREVPPRLRQSFAEARLVIAKGDLNYRRITSDAVWPPATSLAEAVGDFPAPLLALRTVKSDTLVGVDPERVAALNEASSDNWRTKGTYGVAQFAP